MREGEYTLFGISSPNRKEVEEMELHLKPLGYQSCIVKDGRLYRLQLGLPTVKRHTVYKRLEVLQRAGIMTAHVVLS